MHEENLNRLNSIHVGIDNIWYLHYYPYHRDLLAAFGAYAKGQLLDIGCGNKPYKSVLDAWVEKYMGCDIVQSNLNCVDILCEANNIPLDDGLFDTVISTQTIEHVADHQGLVNEAFRLLKSDGYFILSGPMYWPLHEEPYDFFRFTKYGFSYILEKAGFTITEIKPNGGKWSVAGQALLHALYPQVYNIKGLKGKLIRGILRLVGGIRGINRFFLFLENKWLDETNTLNYVVVAQKIVQK